VVPLDSARSDPNSERFRGMRTSVSEHEVTSIRRPPIDPVAGRRADAARDQTPDRRGRPTPPANAAFARVPAAKLFLPGAMLLALLLPTELSVNLGSLRFTAYRLILVLATIPCVIRVFTTTRALPDVLMLAFGLWVPFVLTYHHGPEVGLETGGIQALELVGAYFVARASVRDLPTLAKVGQLILLSVLALMPFVVYEAITGHHILKDTAAMLTGSAGLGGIIDTRYGFTRAFGTFDHPILLGVFAASAVPFALYMPWRARFAMGPALGLAFGAALCAIGSLSSGAIATLMTQAIIVGWDRMTRALHHRWLILTGMAVGAYILIDALSNRSGLTVLISYLTFDQNTAYGRTIIWEFGFWENAVKSPFVGIGLNDWVRPSWIVSPSVDNQWLLVTMQYGFPGILMILTALLIAFRRAVAACRKDRARERVVKAWAYSLFGLTVAAATVAFWNSSLVYFSFVFGCWGAAASRSRRPANLPISEPVARPPADVS
jgi:hypothetical protein